MRGDATVSRAPRWRRALGLRVAVTDLLFLLVTTVGSWRLRAEGALTGPHLAWAVALAAAQAALADYLDSVRKVGHDITRSGIFAALHQPGVQRVQLTAPAADVIIDTLSAGYCTAITLTDGGTDE